MLYGKIVCVGDSMTEGSRDENGKGYPFYLEKMLSEEYDQAWICFNEGVAGETSYEINQRIYQAVSSYPDAHEVVINCGTNDSKVDEPTDLSGFKDNIQAILRRVRILGKRIYFANVPELNGFGLPDEFDKGLLEDFNRYIESEVWTEPDVHPIDLREGFDERHYSDGVHFNAAGYRRFARQTKSKIEEVRQWQPEQD